jgi:exodeoxyribonuclease VIII
MDNESYHRHPAVSKSRLDSIARSPLHYWAKHLDPNRWPAEATPAMVIGSAVHTSVLEPDEWDANYAVTPAGINRRTNAGKAEWDVFTTAAGSRTVISREDADLVGKITEGVFAHPAAGGLLGLPGKAETSLFWKDAETGLECKCRPDFLLDDGSTIVDLKTTESASPADFMQSIVKFRYHVQAAWYLHGVEQATGKRPEQFVFVCIEKRPPFACAVYVAAPEMVQIGWDTARANLNRLAECMAADAWPGYSDQVELINLPAWMRPKADGTTMGQPPEIEMY